MDPDRVLNISRRQFLRAASVATAAAATVAVPADSQGGEYESKARVPRGGLVDTNVTLSRWPFRRLDLDEPEALVKRLRRGGVERAWVGSFDALLHKNISSVNERLVEDYRRYGQRILVPFGSVNPSLPGWEQDLVHCAQLKMRGIRLFPNYHGYKLSDPVFARLLGRAVELRLVVQIALSMEDERTQHPLVQVSHVDPAPLPDLLKNSPGRIILLNWWRAIKPELLPTLAATGNIFFDLATVENVGGLELLRRRLPAERIVFGSNAPLFYFEAAQLKLKESVLPADEAQAIQRGNAQKILG